MVRCESRCLCRRRGRRRGGRGRLRRQRGRRRGRGCRVSAELRPVRREDAEEASLRRAVVRLKARGALAQQQRVPLLLDRPVHHVGLEPHRFELVGACLELLDPVCDCSLHRLLSADGDEAVRPSVPNFCKGPLAVCASGGGLGGGSGRGLRRHDVRVRVQHLEWDAQHLRLLAVLLSFLGVAREGGSGLGEEERTRLPLLLAQHLELLRQVGVASRLERQGDDILIHRARPQHPPRLGVGSVALLQRLHRARKKDMERMCLAFHSDKQHTWLGLIQLLHHPEVEFARAAGPVGRLAVFDGKAAREEVTSFPLRGIALLGPKEPALDAELVHESVGTGATRRPAREHARRGPLR
mmetsp:Transcript_6441/g.21148  ORF Transcript_6441/g.21148 Transcript_6441/m.21148 type:complete len:354 (-) Transcript_6441:26-1087(-)